MFTIDTFGFDEGGTISLDMKDLTVEIDGKEVGPEGDIGILISNVDTEVILRMEEQLDLCLIDQPGLDILESWQIDLPLTAPKKMETTIPAGMANEYSIFYYNCRTGSTVSFDLGIELYNNYNGKKDYLPAGESSLPTVWFGFAFVFFLGLVWWSNHLKSNWGSKHGIHVLMTVLLVLKVMTMTVDGLKLSHMKSTGTGSAWDWIWFLLYGVKGAALFIVIVLIGSGWSFVKPFLQEKEKKIVMVILPLQVINNIALAVTEEENQGSQGWATWRDILHLFDIICAFLPPPPRTYPTAALFHCFPHKTAERLIAGGVLRLRLGLGFGRIVTSEIEAPNVSESGMKWMSGSTKRQCDRALAEARPARRLLRDPLPDRLVDQAPPRGLGDRRQGGGEHGEAHALPAVLHGACPSR
jgi:hypothetical protein